MIDFLTCNTQMLGFEVVEDKHMTEPKLEMLEPVPRFVEYDESDWWWLVKYGYARIVDAPMQKACRMGNRLIMHPEIVAAIKVGPRVMVKMTS